MTQSRSRFGLSINAVSLVVIAALLGAVGGFVLGAARSNAVSHIGVVVGSGENGISVAADGWTYSVPLAVTWVDVTGSLHEGGRPECLPPGIGPTRLKFHSVDVDLPLPGGGSGRWRQVVLVDCR